MNEFLKKVEQKYTLDDFTGHLGVLLDFTCDDEHLVKSGLNFLQELYQMAVKEMEK